MRMLNVAAFVCGCAFCVGGCAALVPGYSAEKERLQQELESTKDAYRDAVDNLRDATKAGDAASMSAALADVTARMNDRIDALTAAAKHEVDSAGKAGTSLLDVVTLLMGGGGAAMAVWAKSRAETANNTADRTAVGPSRSQPEIDEQWEQIKAMKERLAALTGRVSEPVPTRIVVAPPPPPPA